jgi:hypothetical protein
MGTGSLGQEGQRQMDGRTLGEATARLGLGKGTLASIGISAVG